MENLALASAIATEIHAYNYFLICRAKPQTSRKPNARKGKRENRREWRFFFRLRAFSSRGEPTEGQGANGAFACVSVQKLGMWTWCG